MKWPLFEKIIRKRLSGHRSEVDVDALWAAIEPGVDAINRKKGRRRGFLWLLLLAALALGTGIGYWQWNAAQYSSSGTGQSMPASLIGPNTDITSIALPDVEYCPDAPSPLAEQGSTKPKPPAGKAEEPVNLASEGQGVNSNQGLASPKKLEQLSLSVPKGTTTGLSEEMTAPQNKTSPKTLPAVLPAKAAQAQSNPAIPEADKISQKLGPVGYSPDHQIDATAEPELHVLPRKANSKPALAVSVSLQGGLGLTQRILTPRADTFGLPALQALRDHTEQMLENAQAGLLVNLSHKSGLELSSGLHYTQITERFEYNWSTSNVDSVYGIQAFMVNLNNEVDTIYGVIPILEQVTTYNKRYYNRYRLFEIPVLLGYRIPAGDKWSLGVQAGVFANLRLKTEGHVLESADSDIDVEEEGIYETRLGLSYQFGLSANYQLNGRMEVYLSPSMRYFPKSFTRTSYDLEQHYRLYAVQAGVRYYW